MDVAIGVGAFVAVWLGVAIGVHYTTPRRRRRPADNEWPKACPGCGKWRYVSKMTQPCCEPAPNGTVKTGPYR